MSHRTSLARKPTWDDTLVSFDLRDVRAVKSAGGPRERSREDAGPPGKLVAPHRAPRKSGFYSKVDPYAGLEQLDREELDDHDADHATGDHGFFD